jgi:hypothetical protein
MPIDAVAEERAVPAPDGVLFRRRLCRIIFDDRDTIGGMWARPRLTR